MLLLLQDQVIFPSFLFTKFWNFLICLFLTLLNLVSPTLSTGHTTNQNNFQIIGREGQNLARDIKESIYIRVNNPSLNNNIGKFNLSHIWDRVLLNTKGLTLK